MEIQLTLGSDAVLHPEIASFKFSELQRFKASKSVVILVILQNCLFLEKRENVN
ncbi:hypothetical protein DM860_001093 [Cuscuta australis]|uniref:Uncharacterized protein n=1 Tax=Cuscuta australis TaxID=267555 RepID=A0A328DXE6_9ASTE|nr:hypothetical protein DM860_001093 [Cuscuta australis]